MTCFAKQPDRNLKSLAAESVLAALNDAEMSTDRVNAVYFANAVAGSITGQEMVAGQVTLAPLGFHDLPVINVENACASAATAFHLAWQAVASGAVDVALAVGAEKMTHPKKARSLAAIGGALDVEERRSDAGDRSQFMDIYAAEAREYMKKWGATQDDFARVVVKNQFHGSLNPLAQYGDANLNVETVLAEREVVWPLTLRMCSPISDGSAAAILVSEKVPSPIRRRIRVAATTLRSNHKDGNLVEVSSRASYERASIGPSDLHVVELHDAAASAELALYEQLGLTEEGGGIELIRTNATGLGGRIPVNVSGGLLSRGHPIGATGLGQIFEIVTQLRGEAGERQVLGAQIGLAQNGGGHLRGDVAVAAVTILAK